MNKKAIYLSIKPKFAKLIETGEKNYEFRKYVPKQNINTLYVYESAPTSVLKYIIELGDIFKYPEKINFNGYGNNDFNAGLKEAKFAYEIKTVYELEPSIPLSKLKEEFGFVPPQSYAYDNKYPKLTQYLAETDKRMILDRGKND